MQLGQWFKIKLTNSWMNSVIYLAAMAHVGWAALLLLSVHILSARSTRADAWASGALLVFAVMKEFVYDANFEIPKQSFKDNAEDFLGYLGGVVLGWAIIEAAAHWVASS